MVNPGELVWRVDRNLRYLYVNPAVEGVNGLPLAAHLGKTRTEVGLPNEGAAALDGACRAAIASGESRQIEICMAVVDGRLQDRPTQPGSKGEDHLHYYRVRVVPELSPDGSVVSILGISTDITEQKKTQEALYASEARYRRLVETHPDALLIHTRERIVYLNPAALRLLRATAPEQYLDHSPLEVVAPQFRQVAAAWLEQNLPLRQPTPLQELQVLRHDRRPLDVEVTAHGFEWQGEPAVEVVLRDITARKAAEEALRTSEARYRAIFEHATDAIFIHDATTGAILDVNPQTCQLLGVTPEQARRRTVGDFSGGEPPYSPDQARRWLAKALAEGPQQFEWQGRNQAGELFWVEVHLVPITLQGRPCALTLARDISERKRVEQALRESEQRYRELVERSPDSIMVISAGRYVYVNPAGAALAGAESGAAMVGRSTLDNVHPDDRATVLRRWQRTASTGTYNPPLDERLLRFDGRIVDVEAASGPIIYQGEPAIQVILRDQTKRKLMEQSLRESRACYKNFFESMDESFISCEMIYDREGRALDYRYLEVNPAYCRMVGLPAEAVVGRTIAQVFPDIAADRVAAYQRVVQGGRSQRAEHAMALLNRYFDTYSWPTGPGRFAAVINDITQRRQAELALRQAHEALEARVAERTGELSAANQALGRHAEQLRNLAARLTLTEHHERRQLAVNLHDGLQQLLNIAELQVGMMRRGQSPAETARSLAETDRLLAEALEAARLLTADLFPPVPNDAPLADVLEWLREHMAPKYALQVSVHADRAVQPETQEISILLYQSVRELLVNVAKHAGVAGAEVTLSGAEDNHVRIVVADRGRGFDPARTPKPGPAGGFGLFSIRERLELMGGSFAIDSAPGRGTRVTLTAPGRTGAGAHHHT